MRTHRDEQKHVENRLDEEERITIFSCSKTQLSLNQNPTQEEHLSSLIKDLLCINNGAECWNGVLLIQDCTYSPPIPLEYIRIWVWQQGEMKIIGQIVVIILFITVRTSIF